METLIHIASAIFLAILHVFTHFAILLFTSIVGIILTLGGIAFAGLALTGCLGFGFAHRRHNDSGNE